MKRMKTAALLLACFVPGVACADPITIVATLSAVIGTSAAVFVANAAVFLAANWLTVAAVGLAAFAAAGARTRGPASAKADLQDRSVTALRADPQPRTIYGRGWTGGDIFGIFTTDKTATNERGDTYTKADAYKHILIIWSSRQCQQIHDIKIDGVLVGALDGNGWSTNSDWAINNQTAAQRAASAGGAARSMTLAASASVISVTLIVGSESASVVLVPAGGPNGWSLSGTTLTLPNTVFIGGVEWTPGSGDQWECNYTTSSAAFISAVRVHHHLGSPDQAADSFLVGLIPDTWTAEHRARGRCYSVVTLDLERPQFQGGPPGITADISGALVLDRRSGLTAWSDNPALCTDDWLRSELGFNVALSGVEEAALIASANACDETIDLEMLTPPSDGIGPPSLHSVPAKRYTCNGVFTAAASKETVKQDLADSMAGWVSYSGKWRVLAGTEEPLYDVTTLYFEADKEDELRKVGYSKERRVDPQIVVDCSWTGAAFHWRSAALKATRPRRRPSSRLLGSSRPATGWPTWPSSPTRKCFGR